MTMAFDKKKHKIRVQVLLVFLNKHRNKLTWCHVMTPKEP